MYRNLAKKPVNIYDLLKETSVDLPMEVAYSRSPENFVNQILNVVYICAQTNLQSCLLVPERAVESYLYSQVSALRVTRIVSKGMRV